MPIYEIKRAVVGTFPDLALKPKPSLTEIIDDFEKQLGGDRLKALMCNIMQHSANSFIVHLVKAEQVPEFVAEGITFRGHPVKLAAAKATTTVILEKVPYGLNAQVLAAELRPYGVVKGSKTTKYKGLGLSKIIVEMEIKTNIPSRMFIQGNPINVFYRNQPRSCFACGQSGHEAKSCPSKKSSRLVERASDPSASNAPAQTSSTRLSDNRKRPRVAVSDDDEENPSFSDVVRGNRSQSPPPPPPAVIPPPPPPPAVIPPPPPPSTSPPPPPTSSSPPPPPPALGESESTESRPDLDQSPASDILPPDETSSVIGDAAPVDSSESSVLSESQVESAPVLEDMETLSGTALLARVMEEPPKTLIPRPSLPSDLESAPSSLSPPDVGSHASTPADPPTDPGQDGAAVSSPMEQEMDVSSGSVLVERLLEDPPTIPASQPSLSSPVDSGSTSKSDASAKDSVPSQANEQDPYVNKITRVRRSRKGAKPVTESSLPLRKSTRPSPVPTTRKSSAESSNRYSSLHDEGDTQ